MSTITEILKTEEDYLNAKNKYIFNDVPTKYPCVLAGFYMDSSKTLTGKLFSTLNIYYTQDKLFPDELHQPMFQYPKSFIKKMSGKYHAFISNHKIKGRSHRFLYQRSTEYIAFLEKFSKDFKVPYLVMLFLQNDYGDEMDRYYCMAREKMYILTNYCGVKGHMIFIPKDAPEVLKWVEENKPDFITKC